MNKKRIKILWNYFKILPTPMQGIIVLIVLVAILVIFDLIMYYFYTLPFKANRILWFE